MKKVIQDLWIQRVEGTVIFSRVFHDKIETQLFGALMSALNSFAIEIASGGLSNFVVSNIKFSVGKKDNLFFIASYKQETNEKKVKELMDTISEKFIDQFPETTNDVWCEDLNKYLSFEKEIESLLQDPVKKFWNDF